MTLDQLWTEFGGLSNRELVFSLNGEEAVPVRGAIDFETADGEAVIYLTNQEGAKDDLHKVV